MKWGLIGCRRALLVCKHQVSWGNHLGKCILVRLNKMRNIHLHSHYCHHHIKERSLLHLHIFLCNICSIKRWIRVCIECISLNFSTRGSPRDMASISFIDCCRTYQRYKLRQLQVNCQFFIVCTILGTRNIQVYTDTYCLWILSLV